MRIPLVRLNLLLYAFLATLVGAYWTELRWAAERLPGYLRGAIGQPVERALELEARGLIDDNEWQRERARRQLERSLAIEPHGEAGYWLAEVFREAGQLEQALAQYAAYLEIDPTCLEAYLAQSAIHERSGRLEQAVAVLRPGLAYFERYVELYRPVPGDVAPEFNRKALETHTRYRLGAAALGHEIERIQAKSARASPAARSGP